MDSETRSTCSMIKWLWLVTSICFQNDRLCTCIYSCIVLQKLPLWSSREFWQVTCGKLDGKCNSELLRWCYSLLTVFWDITCWYFLVFRIWEPALPGVLQECTEFIWIGNGRHYWTWLLNRFYTVVTYNVPFHVDCQENSMLFVVFSGLGAGKTLS